MMNSIIAIAKQYGRSYVTPEDVGEALSACEVDTVRTDLLEILGKQTDFYAEDSSLCAFIAWRGKTDEIEENREDQTMQAYAVMCSPRPRPSVQKGAKGHQWWLRDIFHLVDLSTRKALCGRDASEWLKIDDLAAQTAIENTHCCTRCAGRYRKLMATARLSLASFKPGDPEAIYDCGAGIGTVLPPDAAPSSLVDLAQDLPITAWAGEVETASILAPRLAASPEILAEWADRRIAIAFGDEPDQRLYPVEQFINGRPVPGLADVLAIIGHARVAWLWLRTSRPAINDCSPLDYLKAGDIQNAMLLARRDFA